MKIKILYIIPFLMLSQVASAQQTVEVNYKAIEALRLPAKQFQISALPPVSMRPPAPLIANVNTSPPMPIAEKNALHGLPGELSGSFGVVSDYKFRGVSQTSRNPAIQGNIDYNHESGAHVGIWASNVDFTDGKSSTEFDFYAGYANQITPEIGYDAGLIYYVYPGAGSLDYDYIEIYFALENQMNLFEKNFTFGASLNYSPDNFGKTGQAYYLAASAETEIEKDITIDAHLGYQWVEDNLAFALPDYLDWSLGAAYNIGEGYSAKLQYTDTNIDESDCSSGCDASGVLSLTKSF